MPVAMDALTKHLRAHVAGLTYDDIHARAAHGMKVRLVDTIGWTHVLLEQRRALARRTRLAYRERAERWHPVFLLPRATVPGSRFLSRHDTTVIGALALSSP